MFALHINAGEFSRRTARLVRRSVSETFLIPFRHLPRVLFHGMILASIVAGFWLLDSLKDPVLASIVGIEYQPVAKVFSVIVTLVVTCVYDFLTSWLSKPNLFHLVSVVFGLIMMVLSAMLSDPKHGLSNFADKGPHRTIGWVAYFTIEVYGSLMVALFWSFTNSIMDLEHAKGAYGLIISIAQIGAIIGSTCATQANRFGIPQLFLMSAMSIFSVSLMIKLYYITYKNQPTMTDPIKHVHMVRFPSASASRSRSSSGHDDTENERLQQQQHDTGLEMPPFRGSVPSTAYPVVPASAPRAAALLSEHGMVQTDDEGESDEEGQGDVDDEEGDSAKPLVSTKSPNKAATAAKLLVSAGSAGGSSSSSNCSSSSGSSSSSSGWLRLFSGFYDGLSLILRHRYVLQLLGVSTLYEIVVTVLDYQFKMLGAAATGGAGHSNGGADGADSDGDRFANLLGHFGQLTNLVSFFMSLFGFSFLVRRIGVRSSLMIFPTVLFIAVLLTNLVPTLPVLFIAVSVIKALVFSLHDPVHELLYIPTSQPIKFKAKAWIDVVGSRLNKAGGSFITNMAAGNAERLRNISEIPCLVIAVALIALAYSIGTEFQRLVDNKIVIGADDVPALVERGAGRGRVRSRVGTRGQALKSRSFEEAWGSRSGSYDYQDPDLEAIDEDAGEGVAVTGGTAEGPVDHTGKRPGDIGYEGYDNLQGTAGSWPEEDEHGRVVGQRQGQGQGQGQGEGKQGKGRREGQAGATTFL